MIRASRTLAAAIPWEYNVLFIATSLSVSIVLQLRNHFFSYFCTFLLLLLFVFVTFLSALSLHCSAGQLK